ncbi:hypothetical protein A2X44_03395 [candidate division CPR3 bacterium GWF2_35_18]|uniref:Uncharacterized protein n=1 Tax=candidate division CPR3 bacterium GW2011_GWF2_35_18 TaxID=1618350 RepID=A0A0G0EQE4_UNCC3|nr:MAG: hypothetical protein UR67_C0005G0041 [candidate division CPR3 bacterium GW2011_GWF2_35_18]KKP85814.1 MAG: hypothetical protein UR87_C0038G0004 [candidate division CPR3 bacterium GW2011_GWE2_35_7]OGB63024.1 MAG: hypothetical protein A2X44_03395 [candidate division CPR3 bacterium GWF2_35_18]OGB63952.1 MAG: hypothetical protein A2250_02810 [candidate division CPR3 bacterium RIFOXYA2_FULL_35_13]OGB75879.1 MAG: hypothetical protein A2476_00210 [candidate division CPR3 bacterium RIFOXYC2_FULL
MKRFTIKITKIILMLSLLIIPLSSILQNPTLAACTCINDLCVAGAAGDCIASRAGAPCKYDNDCSVLSDVNCTACSIITFVFKVILPWTFGIGILAAVVFLVIGGIRYITAGDDPKKISDAKGTVTWAVIGLVILIIAGSIVRLIWLFFGFEEGKIFLIPTTTADIPGQEPVLDCILCE